MSTTNDRDLVEASLGGDVRAFAGLVERYRYAVFGLCLNYTRDFDAAEDAAQEAFIKAFLKLRNLEAGDRFAPWLRQIAVNECRMGYRRRAEPLPESVEKSLVSPATATRPPRGPTGSPRPAAPRSRAALSAGQRGRGCSR